MALRSLGRRKLRSWLTMIGIFIGIAAVVSLISLGEGLSNFINSQFDILGTDVLTVQASGVQAGPPGTGVVTPLTTSQLEAIQRVGGVDYAIGRLIETGILEYKDETKTALVASLPSDQNGKRIINLANLKIESGRLLNPGERNKVMVGSGYAKADAFDSEKFLRPGSRINIEGRTFEVVGVLEEKGSFTVDSTIIMDESQLREIFDIDKEELDVMAIKIIKNVDINKVKLDVEKVLRKERDVKAGFEDFSVETPESALETVNSTLFAVQMFVYMIAAISLIVGGIGITNTMYTAVLERTNEIGIMKAIGAKNSTIFTLFFIESGFLGTVGGIIGIILGVSLAKGVEFFGSSSELLHAYIPPSLLIGALLFSFIVGTLAGIVPAYKASKMNPVDALRG